MIKNMTRWLLAGLLCLVLWPTQAFAHDGTWQAC